MESNLELKLIDCLDALDAGEPISQILARYPADAAALRPMLETAAALPALALEPSASAQLSSRRAFLNRAADMRPAAGRRFLGLPLRLGLTLATLLLAVAVASGGTVTASSHALPGEPLYGLKRAAEQVKISLASDKGQVEREIDQRRRDEIGSLIAQDRSADVEFSGTVTARSGDTLRVTGLTVQITPSTRVDGDPYVGALVKVTGHLADGAIQATLIEILPGGAPVPTATDAPTATASRTATVRPTVTSTPEPTLTHTLEPTETNTTAPTAEPSKTRTPAPRIVPTPRPTLRPVPPPTKELPTAVPPTAEPPTTAPTDDHGGSDNDNENNNALPPPPGPTDDHGGSGGGNDNANTNDGDSGGNANTNDNANANDGGGSGNTNDNANTNDGGGSGNTNDNANTNDGGGSGNTNDNANTNDGGGSGNTNENANTNDGGGSGGAEATAPASPTDDNGSENGNVNENVNENGNYNSNYNSNDNKNENSNDNRSH